MKKITLNATTLTTLTVILIGISGIRLIKTISNNPLLLVTVLVLVFAACALPIVCTAILLQHIRSSDEYIEKKDNEMGMLEARMLMYVEIILGYKERKTFLLENRNMSTLFVQMYKINSKRSETDLFIAKFLNSQIVEVIQQDPQTPFAKVKQLVEKTTLFDETGVNFDSGKELDTLLDAIIGVCKENIVKAARIEYTYKCNHKRVSEALDFLQKLKAVPLFERMGIARELERITQRIEVGP